jgi:hypothetical protein
MSRSELQLLKDTRSEPVIAARRANVVTLSDVQPETLQWLWKNRIPLGKLTIIDGDPGLGKSHLTMDMAARVSTGTPFYGGDAREPAGVILLSAEDGLEDTIHPRLVAAGADLSRVHAFKDVAGPKEDEAFPSFPKDADLLRDEIKDREARLVVIDPLMAYLGGSVNSFSDQEVRRALAPLAKTAQETRCAIVMVRHLNKKTDASALYRGGGSIGIIGAARAAFLLAEDPEDSECRVLASTKSNLGRLAPALRFRLVEGAPGKAHIEWVGECDHSPDDLLADTLNDKDEGLLPQLKDWLASVLREGPQPVQDILARQQANNIPGSRRTLERAKKALGVRSQREGYQGRVFWALASSNAATDLPDGMDGENVPSGEYGEAPAGDHTSHAAVTRHDGMATDGVADLYPEEEAS